MSEIKLAKGNHMRINTFCSVVEAWTKSAREEVWGFLLGVLFCLSVLYVCNMAYGWRSQKIQSIGFHLRILKFSSFSLTDISIPVDLVSCSLVACVCFGASILRFEGGAYLWYPLVGVKVQGCGGEQTLHYPLYTMYPGTSGADVHTTCL